jgi:hypothetical protein
MNGIAIVQYHMNYRMYSIILYVLPGCTIAYELNEVYYTILWGTYTIIRLSLGPSCLLRHNNKGELWGEFMLAVRGTNNKVRITFVKG